VGCILHLHEVVRNGVSSTLHQTLIPKEYARQLDVVHQAGFLERQQGLRVLGTHHPPITWCADD
jgi:hypothetical protein